MYKKWIPSIVVMSFIFFISSLSGKVINSSGLGNETFHINGHFFIFALLAITFYKATKSVSFAFTLCVLYAVSDEIHQMYVPGRSASWFDLFTDSAGAALGSFIIWKFYHNLPKTLKNWLAN